MKDELMEHFDPDVDKGDEISGDSRELWLWQGKSEPIKIEASKFKGKWYLNIRKWYLPKDSGLDPSDMANYKPTKQGISVNVEVAKKLIESIEQVLNTVLYED